jgi:hypothetical protein
MATTLAEAAHKLVPWSNKEYAPSTLMITYDEWFSFLLKSSF